LRRHPYASYEDTYENFVQQIVPILNASLDLTTRGAVFSGPHIQEQRKSWAHGGVECLTGAGRHAWGFNVFQTVLFYGNHPRSTRGGDDRLEIDPQGRAGPRPSLPQAP
jgi:hypothetical protein